MLRGTCTVDGKNEKPMGMWSLGDFQDCFWQGHVRATLRLGLECSPLPPQTHTHKHTFHWMCGSFSGAVVFQATSLWNLVFFNKAKMRLQLI